MAKRERKPVHHVQMTDGKRAISQQLLQEYDIQDAKDIQDALKDLLGGTIKEMMEAEMEHHLGYEKSERTDSLDEVRDYRNGYKTKQVNFRLSKYWLSVLNALKNRGVQDILILCSDGLTGIKDAITAAFPKTEQQRCIVHMVRNTMKYVANKDTRNLSKDLKAIYTEADEKSALAQLDRVTEKWKGLYPYAMKRWHENWDAISPIFKFSKDARTTFYTTNAIESVNSTLRRLNRQRSVFPSSQALLKALYLATFEATKKWTMPIRNWRKVRGEMAIMYPDRIPKSQKISCLVKGKLNAQQS